MYPNSKPWITKHIRQSLQEKHKVFRLKDWESLKLANRKMKNEIFKAKLKFKDQLQSEFANMNIKQAFQKVKIHTGFESKANTYTITDPESFAHELNTLFSCFDTLDFTAVWSFASALYISRASPPSLRRMYGASSADARWARLCPMASQQEYWTFIGASFTLLGQQIYKI